MSQELEKIGEKAVEEGAQIAKEFLGKLLDPALRETGGIIGDTFAYWRFKNKINIALKAKKFLDDKGISPKNVLPKVLVPLLENGSLDTEPTLQDKWSVMLANAATPTANEVKPSFIQILKELSSLEVKLLDKIYDEILRNGIDKKYQITFHKDKVCQGYGLSSDGFDIVIDNLFRLNLCTRPASHGGIAVGMGNKSYPFSIETRDFFHISALGFEFVRSCRL